MRVGRASLVDDEGQLRVGVAGFIELVFQIFEGFEGAFGHEQIEEPGGDIAAGVGAERIFYSDMVLGDGGEDPFAFRTFYADEFLFFRDIVVDRGSQNGDHMGIGVLARDEMGNEIPIAHRPGKLYFRIIDQLGGRDLFEEGGGFGGIDPFRGGLYVEEDGDEPGERGLQN